MPYKDKEKQKQFLAKHYKENKDSYNLSLKKRRQNKKELLDNYKRGKCCEICGEKDIRCLDFHHKDQNNKNKNICELVREAASNNRIITEIKKCILLCSNCHRKKHHDKTFLRKGKKRKIFEYKLNKKCNLCGIEFPPCVLDFHHLEDKEFNISKDIGKYDWDVILNEIKKCKLICSNCHRCIVL